MKGFTKTLGLTLALAFSGLSQAAIGEYKVVLIHGFQPDQLKSQPDHTQVTEDGANYWKDYWLQHADARIDWPSQERIQGKIASDYVWPKLQELSRNNTCQTGCILVTHSTGDLVARYLLDNQENWLTNAGLTPLNIVATFDFAGAGGGSELGDLAVNIATGGGWSNNSMRHMLSWWLGEIPNQHNTGVLNDLKITNARQIAMLPEHRIPRIRFVGDGSDFFKSTSGFLPGHDDGVVSAHSSCGAATAGSYKSCSPTIAMNGKIATLERGVTSFMPNHYPLIMGSGYSHSAVIQQSNQGQVTSAVSSVLLTNGQSIAVDTYQHNGWWGNQYHYVKDSDESSMSEIAAELN